MSTYVTVSVAAPETLNVIRAIEKAFGEIWRLEQILSEWVETSDVSHLNRAAVSHVPTPLGPESCTLLGVALDVARKTGGAFDPTFAGLSGLWDFRSFRHRVPTDPEIAEKLGLVDYRKISFDPEHCSAQLELPKMKIGLGGIAKGFIMDRASAVLTSQGYPNHLVVAGGDLYAAGAKATKPWKIGIRAPNNPGLYATVAVRDVGVATSGNYERFFIKDGVRYHHILDPKTGKPARGLSSVTVLAPNAALADAFATAIFVLGPQKGMALAESQKDLEALVFDDVDFVPHATVALAGRLDVETPPLEAPRSESPGKKDDQEARDGSP